ncbi:EaA protein [Salmonella phage 21]|nr:EaA protein [Salmonella phage 21]
MPSDAWWSDELLKIVCCSEGVAAKIASLEYAGEFRSSIDLDCGCS